jgi:hypothetical protein
MGNLKLMTLSLLRLFAIRDAAKTYRPTTCLAVSTMSNWLGGLAAAQEANCSGGATFASLAN